MRKPQDDFIIVLVKRSADGPEAVGSTREPRIVEQVLASIHQMLGSPRLDHGHGDNRRGGPEGAA